MSEKTIFQALPSQVLQLNADKSQLDNGNWFVVSHGQLVRVITEVDPGNMEPKKEPVFEDQRMGPMDTLDNYGDVSSRVKLGFATGQRAVMEALLGPMAEFLSKTELNARNIVGDPAVIPDELAEIGHLMLVKVNLESGGGTYDMEFLRQLYPDFKSTLYGTDYRFCVWNNTTERFEDICDSGVGGDITWGTNRYMGECTVGSMTLTADHLLIFDPAQNYSVSVSDGIELADVPEWDDLDSGDTIIIVSVQDKYCQMGTDASDSSYQIDFPFASNERRPLELFRMLGDAAGGRSYHMIRRVYPFARPASAPTEATRGSDGTPNERSIEFEVFRDTTKFGNGQLYFTQLWDLDVT
jgi:hypothetical protein